jgi:hypothetical protein
MSGLSGKSGTSWKNIAHGRVRLNAMTQIPTMIAFARFFEICNFKGHHIARNLSIRKKEKNRKRFNKGECMYRRVICMYVGNRQRLYKCFPMNLLILSFNAFVLLCDFVIELNDEHFILKLHIENKYS